MPFTDGAGYERFMARWSSAVGAIFLEWIAPPAGARWLDVGCGTGAFTKLVLDKCSPAAVVAVDPSAEQIQFARQEPIARQVEFQVVDGQSLPFPSGAFDVVASALVINFIPDRPRAIAEMRRVGRPGGWVAGYVWDFAGKRAPGSLISAGLRQIGVNPPPVPGADDSRVEALSSLFAGAGLKDIATHTIDVSVSFPGFNDFWVSSTPKFRPVGKMIAELSESDRQKVKERVRASLPAGPDGSITCSARANAVKARVPE